MEDRDLPETDALPQPAARPPANWEPVDAAGSETHPAAPAEAADAQPAWGWW